MKKISRYLCAGVLLIVLSGCGYGYYFGLHGPSIQQYPGVHEGVSEDADCLGCHSPDSGNDDALSTSHPSFTGCIKCHNDLAP
ncbi:MAG: cytochrome c3 family protein [Desulfopila sp.]|nr:cytochrome c3 family protein [Desulfopila sp.]